MTCDLTHAEGWLLTRMTSHTWSISVRLDVSGVGHVISHLIPPGHGHTTRRGLNISHLTGVLHNVVSSMDDSTPFTTTFNYEIIQCDGILRKAVFVSQSEHHLCNSCTTRLVRL